jgi:hypothetical protein
MSAYLSEAEEQAAYERQQAGLSTNYPAVDLDPQPFRLWTPGELLAADRAFAWTIRGMLSRPTYGPIAGERKSLKSYIGTFIALGVASGTPIFDHFKVPNPGPVVAYVGEGGRIPFTDRLERIAAAMGVRLPGLELYTSFEVAPFDSGRFQASLARDLAKQPALVLVDPLYAFHPPTVRASDLYARGGMLAGISSPCVDAGVSLLIPDHWNKTGTGRGLDRISQAGVQEWADTWLLVSHREQPNVPEGQFWLLLEISSRRWGGATWELDLSIGRFDEDLGEFHGDVGWELRRHMETDGKAGKERKAEGAILSLLHDEPWQHTRSKVVERIGGKAQDTREALAHLEARGRVQVAELRRVEGGRQVRRDLVAIHGTPFPGSDEVGQGSPGEDRSRSSDASTNPVPA